MITIMAALALSATAGNPPAGAAVEENPMICRTGQPTVGSRLGAKRKCLRKSDWELIEKQSQRDLQSFTDKQFSPGMMSPDRAGGPQ